MTLDAAREFSRICSRIYLSRYLTHSYQLPTDSIIINDSIIGPVTRAIMFYTYHVRTNFSKDKCLGCA